MVVEDLVRNADVVIDNYRPGVLAKFGLDHDALHRVNPAIVTCSLTGYGETGPDAPARGVRLHDPGIGGRHEPGRRARRAPDEGGHLLRGPQRRDHRRARCVRRARRTRPHRDRDSRRSRAVRRADLDVDLPRVVAAQPRRHLQPHRELRAPVARARAELPDRRRSPRALHRQRRHVASVRAGARRSVPGRRPVHEPRRSLGAPRRGPRPCAGDPARCHEPGVGDAPGRVGRRLRRGERRGRRARRAPDPRSRAPPARRAPGVRRATSTSAARSLPAVATPWARRPCSASTPARPWRGSGTRRRGSPSSGRRA